MDTNDVAKRAAGRAALAYVTPGALLGVGTGSTVRHFVEALGESGTRPSAAVPTSSDTERLLRDIGVPLIALEFAEVPIPVYVDGADEVDGLGRAIKGGGGAHAAEKRVARASSTWVCIVDESKLVDRLGETAPVPLEVAERSLDAVIASIEAMGGSATVRAGSRADSGNPLVDVRGLDLSDPERTEDALEAVAGVVACGIFAHRRADVVVVGRADGSVSAFEPG